MADRLSSSGDWDYIIVGAGTAGCVLANRLSANPENRVLLLEAGGESRGFRFRVPIGYFRTIGDPACDWCYRTDPEPHLGGRRLEWPRGRGLGGSSAINGLVYVRGHPADFDDWDRRAKGWSFNEILPYFRRSESQERGSDSFHGADGPLPVADGRAQFRITDLFRLSAIAQGSPANHDCNGATQEGTGYYQITARNGWRVSAAHAFLDPVRRRSNLRVVLHAHVTRLRIQDGRADAVTVRRSDGSAEAHCARGEIILSAGAVGSPQILMLSGLGDAEHLRSFGIAPLVHAPRVGRNLQDHLKFHNAYRTSIPTLNGRLNSLSGRLVMGLEFAARRSGPLTMGAAPVFAFLRSSNRVSRPDIQLNVMPWSSDDPNKGFHPWPGFSVSICPIRPDSRGRVRLRSADPMEPPSILANYLSTRKDCRVALDGLKRAQAICRLPPVADAIDREAWPGPELAGASDDQLLDAIKGRCTTIYHPVGTVAMGDTASAPLDADCRLRGVDALRVVDASVMPSIVSGNTNAAVCMIAERSSDRILAAGS